MKRVITICAALLVIANVFAQAPETMSYQAVVRDASDNLVTSQSIGMQISILQGTSAGAAIYTERHYPTTNINGLVSIEIGDGTIVSGVFSSIDWSDGPYFIKSETDLNGGANYTIVGTSPMLSVPYALHAKNVKTYKIGDFAHGGIVFWVDETGNHGLVAAIEDQDGGSGVKWRGGGINYVTNARGDEVYGGKMNTSIIIAVHSAKDDIDDHAALIAANYGGGGFGDWYLPSKEELNLMYQEKAIIDSAATANGGSTYASTTYWSSTEMSGHNAYYQNFGSGGGSYLGKNYAYRVRAVRAF